MSPRLRASRDRKDLALDFSIGRIPRSTVRVFVESRELLSANELFYLILQIEARHGGMPTRVVVQAVIVFVPYWYFPPSSLRGSKVNFGPRVDKYFLYRDSELVVRPVARFTSSGRLDPRC